MPRSYSKIRYHAVNNTHIVLPAGNTTVVTRINFTRAGRIHKVIVKQTGGAATAFTFDLYDLDPQVSPSPPQEFTQVINSISVASGATGTFSSDIGTPFVNPNNCLYAKISLGSAAGADLSFDLAILWQTND